MKKIIFLTALVIVFALNGVDLSFVAKTGDADFDLHLSDVNMAAKVDLKAFMDETAVEYKSDNVTLSAAMNKYKMEPAELYLTLEIAKITKKEPSAVMIVYSENKKEGWGAIAKKLGIKPGSREFKALKKKTIYKKEKNKRDRMKKEDEKTKKINDEKAKDIKPVEPAEKKSEGGKASKPTKENAKSGKR